MIEFRAEHFSLDFENEKKWYQAVTDFNMHIDAGEMVALIGESGCGIHHGAFYDGPSAAKYTHYGAHVFKRRKWARGFK